MNLNVRIRPAIGVEAQAISELAIRSKGHWEYTAEQMAVFRQELTLTAEQLARSHGHVLEARSQLFGFYTLASLEGDAFELEHLFVDPDHLGLGYGRRLFDHACQRGSELGATRLIIQSDPNAAGFYSALGATLERQIPSSIPGRSIPFFSVDL